MWRCFSESHKKELYDYVFSTHVEMFLVVFMIPVLLLRFLHACGDVSKRISRTLCSSLFSPRMWRCFYERAGEERAGWVFSTHVEMFRSRLISRRNLMSFLHACGDVSRQEDEAPWRRLFSPRLWRCFRSVYGRSFLLTVFSTHVEMFLAMRFRSIGQVRFLHACGDVSYIGLG